MGNNTEQAQRMSRGSEVLIGWVVLRLPLLLVLVYLLREQLMAAIEPIVGTYWPTAVCVILISTVVARIVLFLGTFVILSLSFTLMASAIRSRLWLGLVSFTVSCGLFLALFHFSAGFLHRLDIAVALALSVLLLGNTLPAVSEQPEGSLLARLRSLVFTCGVGIEVLLPRPFLDWMASRLGEDHRYIRPIRRWIPSWFPGVCTMSALSVLYLSATTWAPAPDHPQGILELQRAWHSDLSVELINDLDCYCLELNQDKGVLYASGWGAPRILAFDTKTPYATPRASPVDTKRAENFAYDPIGNELFVYMTGVDQLVVLDAATLELRRSLDVTPLAEGEVIIVWDARAGQVFLLSEADVEDGPAFAAIDAQTGELHKTMDLDAGSGGLLDPNRPLLYLGSFRRRSEIVVYNTEQHEIVATIATDSRIDGLAFDERADQLLVSSPLNSAVLRYDAASYEQQTTLKTSFGARSLALDTQRNLLLTASIASNHLEVIDLTTERVVASYWLGPWLRRIALDAETGIAYVSSRYGLFRVSYIDRLAANGEPGQQRSE